jgi:hypothetical protein
MRLFVVSFVGNKSQAIDLAFFSFAWIRQKGFEVLPVTLFLLRTVFYWQTPAMWFMIEFAKIIDGFRNEFWHHWFEKGMYMKKLSLGKKRGLDQCAKWTGVYTYLALDHRQAVKRFLLKNLIHIWKPYLSNECRTYPGAIIHGCASWSFDRSRTLHRWWRITWKLRIGVDRRSQRVWGSISCPNQPPAAGLEFNRIKRSEHRLSNCWCITARNQPRVCNERPCGKSSQWLSAADYH